MRLRTITGFILAVVLLTASGPAFSAAFRPYFDITFREGADALSVRLPLSAQEARLSYEAADGWSEWIDLAVDPEDDPESRESELFMFPVPVSRVRVQGIAAQEDVHPITVSREPVRSPVASLVAVGKPIMLTRSQWGADDALLFDGKNDGTSSEGDLTKGDLGVSASQPDQSSQRQTDCQKALQDYPEEFALESTVTKDKLGRRYKWPLQYSKSVRLLVLHHTALLVRGDPRSPVERVRALYKYHTLSKSWGDIGYNYLIDEEGQIYEGRQGGEGVVGGHAYCNNVGTIGIALMGNFEIEQPSQAQVRSAQWLMAHLAEQYHLDVRRPAEFHGKKFDAPLVRHRDLLSTLCPGYFVTEAFSQLVVNVKSGNVDGAVTFPVVTGASSSRSSTPVINGLAEGMSFIGRTSIAINPGGKQRLSFTFTAGQTGAYEGKKIADVSISSPQIKLSVDIGGTLIPVTKGILLDYDLPAYETTDIQLMIEAPIDPGNYAMVIGGVHFTISVSGRRARTGTYINPFAGNPAMIVQPKERIISSSLRLKSAARRTRMSLASSSASSQSTSSSKSASSLRSAGSIPSSVSAGKGTVRIRLSAGVAPTVTFSDVGSLNGRTVTGGAAVQLFAKGNTCEALVRGERLLSDLVLRMQSNVSKVLAVDSVRGTARSYRGVLECRIVDGAVALINELPIEEYLAGLSEEPDSEPYEKQRAFAVAARTYAAYYTQEGHRKFTGKPYDGSDDPATFQAYAGVEYASNNPRWVQAVTSTAGQTLSISGELIRPPYFSSDSGRTKSPAEAGWSNFPNAEVFQSKDDPWCVGKPQLGHGVGMSGCGAKGQALEGRSGEQILQYYYPKTRIIQWP